MKRSVLLVCLLLLIPILATACGSGDDGDDEPPEDLNALLVKAADELDNATSFQLVLRQEGAPTYFAFDDFEALSITFNNATATFVSPNTVKADLSVAIDAATQKGEIVAIEDRQYFRQALITGGDWDQQTLVSNFQPADLQSADQGIGSALREMQNVEFIGAEERDSLPVYHLRGTVAAQRVRSVTVGLMATETGEIVTNVYIRRDNTGRLAFIELTEPSPPDSEEDLSKTWVIEFRGYNQSYTIEEPTPPEAS